jgi:hypothetical protein
MPDMPKSNASNHDGSNIEHKPAYTIQNDAMPNETDVTSQADAAIEARETG